MRLTDQQVHTIRSAADEAFGPGVELRLFGSRVDDSQRGGDIDLYVATGETGLERLLDAEIAFLAKLKTQLGDQRIDLVVDYPARRTRPPILDIAKTTGVPL